MVMWWMEGQCSTVKLVYKGHSRQPENVLFICSLSLFTGFKNMHCSLMVNNETALYRQWFVIYRCPYRQLWLWLINLTVTGNWSECYTWKRSVNCNTSIIREWYCCVPSEPRKRGKNWGICWNFGTAMAVVSHFRNSGYSR